MSFICPGLGYIFDMKLNLDAFLKEGYSGTAGHGAYLRESFRKTVFCAICTKSIPRAQDKPRKLLYCPGSVGYPANNHPVGFAVPLNKDEEVQLIWIHKVWFHEG